MSQNEETLKKIEVTIEDAKKAVALFKSFEKLLDNSDFKAVITEGYFKDESVRLVLAKATPDMDTPEMQAGIIRSIDSIGLLRQYFVAVTQAGRMAERAILENEEVREEILAEDLNATAELEA